jgi:hypothetical protein
LSSDMKIELKQRNTTLLTHFNMKLLIKEKIKNRK